MDMMQDFVTKCRDAGLRVTPQRIAVYKALAESREHPSADMLYRRVKEVMPSISLDTVNHTLLTFVEIDAASVVEGSGDVRRFDGDTHGHQHFRCIRCRRIIDFHYDGLGDIEVPEEIGSTCKVLRKTVYFEGICDLCIGSN
jgi:Fur family peroxide stress response transcriptional regulator